jgi:hypothetical protein
MSVFRAGYTSFGTPRLSVSINNEKGSAIITGGEVRVSADLPAFFGPMMT